VDAGTFFVLIFPGCRDAERLAHVLLVYASQAGGCAYAIVALHDDGEFFLKAHDSGAGDGEPNRAPQFETEVLVLDVAMEMPGRRFEDVESRKSAFDDIS
jgi:hypothetical protein